MRLVVSREALDDIAAIGRYSERRWGRARKQLYMEALRDRIIGLKARPNSGRRRPDVDDKIRFVRSGRHLVFYDVEDDSIVVQRVLHDSMDVAAKLGAKKP